MTSGYCCHNLVLIFVCVCFVLFLFLFLLCRHDCPGKGWNPSLKSSQTSSLFSLAQKELKTWEEELDGVGGHLCPLRIVVCYVYVLFSHDALFLLTPFRVQLAGRTWRKLNSAPGAQHLQKLCDLWHQGDCHPVLENKDYQNVNVKRNWSAFLLPWPI